MLRTLYAADAIQFAVIISYRDSLNAILLDVFRRKYQICSGFYFIYFFIVQNLLIGRSLVQRPIRNNRHNHLFTSTDSDWPNGVRRKLVKPNISHPIIHFTALILGNLCGSSVQSIRSNPPMSGPFSRIARHIIGRSQD